MAVPVNTVAHFAINVLMDPVVIDGVGELAWLADPSGNPVGVMRYV